VSIYNIYFTQPLLTAAMFADPITVYPCVISLVLDYLKTRCE